MMPIDALVFDAYGTLFDVHSITAQCEEYWPTRGVDVSQVWRSKQLEYSWLQSLMGCYENFDSLTKNALLFTIEHLNLHCEADQITNLMKAYDQLPPFPEVPSVLSSFPNYKAILSNGTNRMLEKVVRNSGLEHQFSAILSVEKLKLFKPRPEVYQQVVETLSVPKERIAFVSSNCWDACGAQQFGLQSFWINRENKPLDRLGVYPSHILRNFQELTTLLNCVPA